MNNLQSGSVAFFPDIDLRLFVCIKMSYCINHIENLFTFYSFFPLVYGDFLTGNGAHKSANKSKNEKNLWQCLRGGFNEKCQRHKSERISNDFQKSAEIGLLYKRRRFTVHLSVDMR